MFMFPIMNHDFFLESLNMCVFHLTSFLKEDLSDRGGVGKGSTYLDSLRSLHIVSSHCHGKGIR